MRCVGIIIAGVACLLPAASQAAGEPEAGHSSAYERGAAEAEAELREDIFGIRVLGTESAPEKERQAILEREYALEVWPVAEKVPDREAYAAGYNARIREALTARYGRDLIASIDERIERDRRLTEEGRKDAWKDIANGRLRQVEYGLPVDWAPKYWQVLAERYGVETEANGCMVTTDELSRSNGYNAAVAEHLREKYGRDVLKETLAMFTKNEEEAKPSALYLKGEAAAKDDLAKGVLVTFMETKTPKWAPLFAENVRAAGVVVKDLDDAEAEYGNLDYCWGYDSISDASIEAKLGRYFFERAKHRAQNVIRKEEEAKRRNETGAN